MSTSPDHARTDRLMAAVFTKRALPHQLGDWAAAQGVNSVTRMVRGRLRYFVNGVMLEPVEVGHFMDHESLPTVPRPVCQYDSGSATDCRPLCAEPAILLLFSERAGDGVQRYCRRHLGAALGALSDPNANVTDFAGEPFDLRRLPRCS